MVSMKDKRIGKVLLIVEGGKHEFNLIKKIFSDILGYEQIEKRRGNAGYYVRKGDKHSVVAVINTKTSNISSINDEEYLDEIFTGLIEHYDFDIDNAAIYYLFDRDPRSNNSVPLITGLMERLKNSRENDDARGGMLILSYPSIEAYEISNFVERSFDVRACLGKELKKFINEKASLIALNKISEDSIIHAGRDMLCFLDEQGIPLDLDDFSDTNKAVFEKEEMDLKAEGTYRVLSMFSCILMDLGLLTEI